MKKQMILLAALLLAACNQNPSHSVASEAALSSDVVAIASDDNAQSAASNTLTSADGRIQIALDGAFVDKRADAQFLPEGEDEKNVLLLQHDEVRNITLSAVDSGVLKSDLATFFTQLRENIKKDQTLNHAQITTAADNRLLYAFQTDSSAENETTIYESCLVAVAKDKQIYTVCAISDQLSNEELNALLNTVRIE